MNQKACNYCQREFTPYRKWQRFCSPEHKREFEKDSHAIAKAVMGEAAKGKNPAAVALGKLGAAARNKRMTPEQRSEASRRAALAGVEKRKRLAQALKESEST